MARSNRLFRLSVNHAAIRENIDYGVQHGFGHGHGALLGVGAGGDFPMLSLDEPSHERWRPPIVKTQATTGDGVNDFVGALDRFREYAGDDLRYQRRYRLEVSELRRLLGEAFWRHVEQLVSPSELDKVTAQLARRELDPYTAVDTIMNRVLAERDAGRKP